MNIDNPGVSMSICVNTCPDRELRNLDEVYQFSEQTGSYLCRYDVDIQKYTQSNKSLQGPCPVTPVKKSVPLLNRCVPSDLFKLHKKISSNIIDFLNQSDIFQKVLTDLYKSWKEMFGLCFVAFAFALVMILLIRYFASIIVWLILTVAVIASIAGTAFLWWTFAGVKSKLDHDQIYEFPLLDVEIESEKAFLAFSVTATILTVILLLVILIIRKRISLVVTLFHEAGNCVAAMPCLLMQPLWTFFFLLIFFVYWVIILAYLSTSEKVKANENGFVVFEEYETVSYFWWYHLIGLIWSSEFIIACQQLAVSGAVAKWYFTRNKESVSCVIGNSVGRMIVYHLGSVATGAVIITIVKLPRWILMYLSKRLKVSDSQCAKYWMKCCICCLWCLEKCLKYLSANAYTIVAISGQNFCTSARKAFLILLSNGLRVAAINSIGDFVLFLGKIGVMAATGAVGILWLKSQNDLHFFAVPVLLCCIFGYFVAHCFLSVFEMVIDALLLCFCEDCDLNDGTIERPYFGNKSLMTYVNESSKKFNEMTKKYGEGECEPAHV
ncbi:choline transporter-like protein 1 isoform X2 [Patella vulgata]|nr:choline transporter-like protein 1 isoform X2 [Patella vulgata]XP_055956605.1 choline transporter-like protein 1 isoform X2 [Patella vulgata]